MRKIEKYNGDKTYMFPNGGIGTPDVIKAKFPAVVTFAHVVETDENSEVMFALQNLSAMCTKYNISQQLTEEEKISLLNEKINTAIETTEVTPSAEERIASALEYQNLMSMPDLVQ